MKILLLAIFVFISANSYSQKQSFRGVSIYNTQSATPFNKFGELVSGIIHPGLELSHRRIFSQRTKHAWFWDAKGGLFYHRFVQYGFPLTANIGYRYKPVQDWIIDASLGAGYLHSLPAHQKFKLNESGSYEKNKGFGRAQGTANFSIGISHTLNPLSPYRTEVFSLFGQQIQMPFIKSYVPLLPYNQLHFGIRRQIK